MSTIQTPIAPLIAFEAELRRRLNTESPTFEGIVIPQTISAELQSSMKAHLDRAKCSATWPLDRMERQYNLAVEIWWTPGSILEGSQVIGTWGKTPEWSSDWDVSVRPTESFEGADAPLDVHNETLPRYRPYLRVSPVRRDTGKGSVTRDGHIATMCPAQAPWPEELADIGNFMDWFEGLKPDLQEGFEPVLRRLAKWQTDPDAFRLGRRLAKWRKTLRTTGDLDLVKIADYADAVRGEILRRMIEMQSLEQQEHERIVVQDWVMSNSRGVCYRSR